MDQSTKNKIAAIVLAGSVLTTSSAAVAAEPDTAPPLKPDANNTFVVKGSDHKAVPGGKVSFIADMRGYSLKQLEAGGKMPFTAVVFRENIDDVTKCPLIDTTNRANKIKQIGTDYVFKTITDATDAEIEAVNAAGCAIAPTAKVGDIDFNVKEMAGEQVGKAVEAIGSGLKRLVPW